jgi:ABC-type phosphate transport system auxiliary subunit
MNLLIAVMGATHFEVTEASLKTNYSELNEIILELEQYLMNFVDESKYVETSDNTNKQHSVTHMVYAQIETNLNFDEKEKPIQTQLTDNIQMEVENIADKLVTEMGEIRTELDALKKQKVESDINLKKELSEEIQKNYDEFFKKLLPKIEDRKAR